MKFYSVDFIRKCVFLLKKEYFLLRKGVIIVIKGMKNGIFITSLSLQSEIRNKRFHKF